MKRFLLVLVLAALAASLYAQDISGDWQGTLKTGPQGLRLILKITKTGNDWSALMLSIDQGNDRGAGMRSNSFTLDGSHVKGAFNQIAGTYDATLSADAKSMSGTWTQGTPLPLEFKRTTKDTEWPDPSPHTTQFITVENDVKIEVLDWGGTGRPLVFVPGLGNSAHVFDKFAPKLTSTNHVYGITRRGFGDSSVPAPTGNAYAADRMGDDVLAVLDALKLNRPVLAGHSLGGEELSSVGSRHPERVAGLIYLDAGYGYAFYDASRGDFAIDLVDLVKKLGLLRGSNDLQNQKQLIDELLSTDLPGFERDLKQRQKNLADAPATRPGQNQVQPIIQAIMNGQQKYTNIPVPVLAIYAVPHAVDRPFKDDAARAAADAKDEENTGGQAKAFEAGVPTARVVRLPHANHYVFVSNEADVLREMNAFLTSLPPQK